TSTKSKRRLGSGNGRCEARPSLFSAVRQAGAPVTRAQPFPVPRGSTPKAEAPAAPTVLRPAAEPLPVDRGRPSRNALIRATAVPSPPADTIKSGGASRNDRAKAAASSSDCEARTRAPG